MTDREKEMVHTIRCLVAEMQMTGYGQTAIVKEALDVLKRIRQQQADTSV